MKILYPDGEATREEIEEIQRFAIEGRKRVKDQILRIDSTMAEVKFGYLDTDGTWRSVATLEEDEYYSHYHRRHKETEPEETPVDADPLGGGAACYRMPPSSAKTFQQVNAKTFQQVKRWASYCLGEFLLGSPFQRLTDVMPGAAHRRTYIRFAAWSRMRLILQRSMLSSWVMARWLWSASWRARTVCSRVGAAESSSGSSCASRRPQKRPGTRSRRPRMGPAVEHHPKSIRVEEDRRGDPRLPRQISATNFRRGTLGGACFTLGHLTIAITACWFGCVFSTGINVS